MSLRTIHLLFITLSALLAVFVAGWAGTEYRAGHGSVYAVGVVLAFATAVGLALYGEAFRRKTRGLS